MPYGKGIVQTVGAMTIICASLLQGTEAIKCYVCQPKVEGDTIIQGYINTVRAKVTTDLTSTSVEECTSNATAAKQVDCPGEATGSFCSKFSVAGMYTGRSCMKKMDSLKEGCEDQTGFKMCLCDDDLCNSSPRFSPALGIMAASALVAMILKM